MLQPLDLAGPGTAPRRLIRLTARGGGHIISVCGSADGRFVAFSDEQRCRLVELTGTSQSAPASVKRHRLPAGLPPAQFLCLTASPSTWASRIKQPKLLLAATDGSLTIYDITSGQTQHVFPALGISLAGKRKRPLPAAPRRAFEQLASPVSTVVVSTDGRRAAVAAASQVQPKGNCFNIMEHCFSPLVHGYPCVHCRIADPAVRSGALSV